MEQTKEKLSDYRVMVGLCLIGMISMGTLASI